MPGGERGRDGPGADVFGITENIIGTVPPGSGVVGGRFRHKNPRRNDAPRARFSFRVLGKQKEKWKKNTVHVLQHTFYPNITHSCRRVQYKPRRSPCCWRKKYNKINTKSRRRVFRSNDDDNAGISFGGGGGDSHNGNRWFSNAAASPEWTKYYYYIFLSSKGEKKKN